MDKDVSPASYAELRGVLPCLQAVAMGQVVQWFPVVEGFIAILYWRIRSCKQMSDEADVEGDVER